MKYNFTFNTLSFGDPVIYGKGKLEEFISVFLRNWNTIYDIETLEEYLEIIYNDNTDHEDYLEILEHGIYDDVHSSLFFYDKEISILFNNDMSERITIIDFKEIVSEWKLFVESCSV